MNSDLTVFLSLIVGIYFLDCLSDFLNLTRLDPQLPQEFQELYPEEKYRRAIQYQRDGVKFEFIRRTVSLLVLIAFISYGGFNEVDLFARNFGFGPSATALVFVGLLSFGKFLIQFPFSIFDTFVLEARYGFNKTTPAVFLGDLIKGTLLGIVLGAPIFLGIVYFFDQMGTHAWIYSWLILTVFQLALLYLAPVVILPLFNRFNPLPEGALKAAIEEYAKTRNFQLQGIFTMDSSKRSTKSNAFFTGFGRYRKLVLFDTLIEKHTVPELVAVLAHEIGHFEKKHITKGIILSIISSAIMFYTFGFFMNNPRIFEAFKMDHLSTYGSIVFISLIYSPILRLTGIMTQWISRKHEFEADRFAVDTYGKPELLIAALKKLSVDNLSHLTPHPLKVLLDYSHPPILQRISALRTLSKSAR